MKKLPFILIALVTISCFNQKADTANSAEPIADPQIGATTQQTHPAFHVAANAGTEWNIFGLKITEKIMSEQTKGAYAVIISKTPPQGGPPVHLHQHEDELFYILAGKYRFLCGTDTIMAEKGSLVHLPKGLPHSFKNLGDSTGIMMNTITPGGFEHFFEDINTITQNGTFSPSKVDSIAQIYGLTFIK